MNNQIFIKEMIQKKNSHLPYTPSGDAIKYIITDIDHFPYKRFYRGIYNDMIPHIWEREAGYFPLQNNRDRTMIFPVEYPNHLFQVPCTTILPNFKKDYLSNTNRCLDPMWNY